MSPPNGRSRIGGLYELSDWEPWPHSLFNETAETLAAHAVPKTSGEHMIETQEWIIRPG